MMLRRNTIAESQDLEDKLDRDAFARRIAQQLVAQRQEAALVRRLSFVRGYSTNVAIARETTV